MTPDEYIKATRKFDNHDEQWEDVPYALGMAAEAGEVANAYERCMRNGNALELGEVQLEVGDVLWQIARLCDFWGWTFEDLMDMNITKLEERYAREGIDRADR